MLFRVFFWPGHCNEFVMVLYNKYSGPAMVSQEITILEIIMSVKSVVINAPL